MAKQTKKEPADNIKKLKKEIAYFEDRWQRTLADYQNLEKRVIRERELQAKLAAKETIDKLLPVFDSLYHAGKHLNDQGLTLALKQLSDTLASLGVKRIESVGKQFDANFMEVVDVKESNQENIVLEEKSAGYLLHDELLRASQVVVGKRKVDERSEKKAKKELQRGDYL